MIRIIASCSLKSHTSKVSPEKVLESYFLCTFSFGALFAVDNIRALCSLHPREK